MGKRGRRESPSGRRSLGRGRGRGGLDAASHDSTQGAPVSRSLTRVRVPERTRGLFEASIVPPIGELSHKLRPQIKINDQPSLGLDRARSTIFGIRALEQEVFASDEAGEESRPEVTAGERKSQVAVMSYSRRPLFSSGLVYMYVCYA